MGKITRLRHKLHITAKAEKLTPPNNTNFQYRPDAALSLPDSNLFADFSIDVNTLETKMSDDIQSVKSSKSIRFDKSKQAMLSKKDKLKLRRDLLLRKIDTVKQMKKDLQLRKKRRSTAIIGDTNPLHDALPSLESLLKTKSVIKQQTEPKKKKGIEKAKKRKREVIQGMKIFKSVLDNKTFQKDPLGAVTQHVQALVTQEKLKLKK